MRLQIQEQIVSSAVGEIIWFIGIELHNIHRRFSEWIARAFEYYWRSLIWPQEDNLPLHSKSSTKNV